MVIREPVRFPLRQTFSDQASARFFYLADAIARLHEPTQTQLSALESSYHSTGEFLSACPEFSGLTMQIHAQGSRQLGTLIRPMDASREGFDIDLVARLDRQALVRYGGEDGPTRLLQHLHTALSRYAEAHGLGIKRWERCVTLEYAGGMFADITPVVDDPLLSAPYGDTHGRVPDRKLHVYDPTNPRGYAKGFAQAAAISPVFTSLRTVTAAFDSLAKSDIVPLPTAEEVFERLLSRLVQLLKLHRNVAFGTAPSGHDVSPTSVFITTLAAAAYSILATQPHTSPLDLLLDIVEAMPRHFGRSRNADGTEEWHLPNPSAPHDNLASGMNTAPRQKAFLWWHQRLTNDLERLLHSIDSHAGMDVMLRIVEESFGKRAASAVLADQRSRRGAGRQLGKVALVSGAAAPAVVHARTHTFFGD